VIPWLAGFLMNPALAVGAAGIASPILIHLLARRRFRKVRWAAMDFLLEAQRRNRRRIRLEQYILLALRCLAVLLLALMIARPFIRHASLGSALGIGPRTERIILLDDSYSMDCRVGPAETVWSRATTAATRIATAAAEEASGDPFSIIITSRAAQPLLSLASLSTENVHSVTNTLETMSPSNLTAHFERAVDSIKDTLKRAPGQPNTTIYVISDFQRPDWANRGPQNLSPFAQFKSSGESSHTVQLVFVDVSQPHPRNLAISDIRAMQPQTITGIPARFEVGVSNFGPNPIANAELDLSVADHVLPPVALPLIPTGQHISELIEVSFPVEGSNYLRAQLGGAAVNDDPLKVDNTRLAPVDALPAIQILLVDGEPSTDSYRDEVYLLKTALRPSGRAASGNEVNVVEEQELDTAELSNYHVVVLANVARLSIAAQKNIETFVENGGGLIVFAGDQLDIPWYNEHLFRGGRGPLPGSLLETVEVPKNADPISFSEWDITHPVLRAFQDSVAKVLRQVRVYAFMKVDDSRGPSSQPQSAPALSGTRVAARWTDPEKSAAMLQKTFGRGTCCLITTSADQEWNDWAANFSYVPFMLELVQNCARFPEISEQVSVGEPLRFIADAQKFAAIAAVRPPGYPSQPEVSVTAARHGRPQTEFLLENTDRPGVYQLLLSTIRGEPISRYAVVNPDPTESDLTPVSDAQLAAAMGDMPFEHVRNVDKLLNDSANARTELWWPLLLLAVGALMSEQALAWYFGTRG
jgi:hypothetical protein